MKAFKINAFYAYPSRPPAIGSTIRQGAKRINEAFPLLNIKTWEQLDPTGRYLIDTICEEIDNSLLFCADLTDLNPNVLFELGYAIGQKKRIWITLDATNVQARLSYENFDLLSGVGYRSVATAIELEKAYKADQPHNSLSRTLFDERLAPILSRSRKPHIFHLKPLSLLQSSVAVTRVLAEQKIPKMVDDPQESTGESLGWYALQIHQAAGVLVHLDNSGKEKSVFHNAKCALVAGMAYALGKDVLMIAKDNFMAPLDYRHLFRSYSNPAEAETVVRDWCIQLLEFEAGLEGTSETELADGQVPDLKRLNLGQHVAENEPDSFLTSYFVETNSYREALAAQSSVFVGRKGVGKTANLLKIASDLSQDSRNLVCVIKPPAYEMEGLVRLLSSYGVAYKKSYAIESLWKFLVITEVANSAANQILNHGIGGLSQYEQDLMKMLDENDGLLREEFSIRLERAVDLLERQSSKSNLNEKIETSRISISEALHIGFLSRLRNILANVLHKRHRVAILIDNLDAAWDANSDLADLSDFVLGLLSVGPRLAEEFHNDRKLPTVPMTLTVFLRADIFHRILDRAIEPDKIRHTRIRWQSPQLLLRVVEERYVASFGAAERGSNLWTKLFLPKISGMSVEDYVTGQILPRPRDILFFIGAAVESAINRKGDIVEEIDIKEAEVRYSKHALASILVENEVSPVDVSAVMEVFYGVNATLFESELHEILREAKVPSTDIETCVSELCSLSFLGIETDDDHFRYVEEPEDLVKFQRLGARFAARKGQEIRYRINRPFWAHLEIRPEMLNENPVLPLES